MGAEDLNMTPRLSGNYAVHSGIGYPVLFGKRTAPSFVFGVFLPNLKNLFFGEFSMVMVFSKRMSSFCELLKSVFVVSPSPKMVGVNAGPIITGVEDMESFWDSSMVDNIRDPMGAMKSPADDDLPISSRIERSGPIPARACFCNGFPKPIFKSVDVVGKDAFHGSYCHESLLGNTYA